MLIIEDHPFVAEAIRSHLATFYPEIASFICAIADEARAAIRNDAREWGCILLNLEIPGATGLSFAQEIRSMGHRQRCCVVSGREERSTVAELHALGFLGYISKSATTVSFASSLKQVLSVRRTFPAMAPVDAQAPTILTERQRQALALVGDGMSSKQIAAALGGIAEGTVNVHINGAMIALGVRKRSHAVTKAMQLGLLKMSTTA